MEYGIARRAILAIVVLCLPATAAQAFVAHARWTTTASGYTGAQGEPITLTWSFVPDYTSIPGESPSGLISFLDTTFGAGPGGSDLAQRPWFGYFQDSFDRWTQLSGISFAYEPHDDSRRLTGYAGQLGVRGDIRLGGASIDGPSHTLAYTYYPNTGDMVLDTDDGSFFSTSTSGYRRLRNTLMHELGHAIGLDHVESNTSNFLMEPYLGTAFDGPQLDDICGVQSYYGDPLEKSHNGAGNDAPSLATNLGPIAAGSTVSIGTDAGPDLVVAQADTDFVSITNNLDVDYYSFSIAEPIGLSATLTPLGGVYSQGAEGGSQSSFDASAASALTLSIFDTNGTSVLAANAAVTAGDAVSLADIDLPAAGDYYARITGGSAQVQLYRLDLSVARAVAVVLGDYNGDGVVDAGDYTTWRDSVGETGAGLAADGNGDLVVDNDDYLLWKANFGSTAGAGTTLQPTGVPEPSSLLLLAIGLPLAGATTRRCSSAR